MTLKQNWNNNVIQNLKSYELIAVDVIVLLVIVRVISKWITLEE